jgi:cell wall-associated NlpC family hydrolase
MSLMLDNIVGQTASLFHPNAPPGDPLLFSNPALDPWADFTNSQVDPVFPEATMTANRRAPKGPSGTDPVFSSSDLAVNPAFDKAATKADKAARTAGVNPYRPGTILDLARSQFGVPYIFGALDPKGGPTGALDCSGLTKYVFGRLGVDLPHSSTQQAAMFAHVDKAHLQPGDLVFFSYGRLGSGVVDHVAIYAGGNRNIAATSPSDPLGYRTMDWSHFMWGGHVPGTTGGTMNPSSTPASGSGGQQQGSAGTQPSALPLLAPAIAYGTQPNLAQVAQKVKIP